ncbi:hypothetical protein [Acetobacterium wieringae]|uniref:hypothetical protein n=1 Tax=Acetobacterium wieringae TaxID=52694 RepID=UPI0026EE74ED|nr:hypothetical protein [Acetobacterium wieringae]
MELLEDIIEEIKSGRLNASNTSNLGIVINEDKPKIKIYYKKNLKNLASIDFQSEINDYNNYFVSLNKVADDDNLNRFTARLVEMSQEQASRLLKSFPLDYFKCDENFDLAINLSKMKVSNTRTDENSISALYYLGFKEKLNKIINLKLYYMTRMYINKTVLQNNNYYFDYLSNQNINPFSKIVQIGFDFCEKTNENIHLVGLDISEKRVKYKMYFTAINSTLSDIITFLSNSIYGVILQNESLANLAKYDQYLNSHISFTGFALCIDNNNELKINLYYEF